MAGQTALRPVKQLRAGGVQAAIWRNEIEQDGRIVVRHSVTLNKRYRGPNTGEWADSKSFFPDDLPRLRLLLDKAYEHILLREGDSDHVGTGADAPA